MEKTVYIEESGCNRRKLDVGKFRKFFLANGYSVVKDPGQASYIIVTTCAFKRSEEESSILRVRHYANHYPAKVVVYGCLPDIAPEKYKEFEHIPSFAPKEVDKIDQLFPEIRCSFAEVLDENSLASEREWFGGLRRKVATGSLFTREFAQQARMQVGKRLKEMIAPEEPPYFLFVCRGCLGKCSYCGIRRSVGQVRSKPRAQVVEEFRQGLEAGRRVFCLLGDDPGCYGIDQATTLPALLRDLLAERDRFVARAGGSVRFDIREIHPKFLLQYRDELGELFQDSAFQTLLCPVQSGSDRVLAAMEREHQSAPLQQTLRRLREQNPAITLDTQIIVGFPGETDADFDATLRYVAETGFDSVVVFPYDDKEGTAARELQPKTPQSIIRQRTRAAFDYFKANEVKAYYNCP